MTIEDVSWLDRK
jgi:hypothetical protein